MTILEALILGVIQGLTEFLPISSSGHLEIGKAIFGHEEEKSLVFTVVVHGATVLSTIVVFYKEIIALLRDTLASGRAKSTSYLANLAISAIPIAVIGLLFQDVIELYFFGNILIVGSMLLVTGLLLLYAASVKSGDRNVGILDALIIGTAQVFAVLPGISRSGATIAAALISGVKREEATKFSFLMVLAPIIGANLLAIIKGEVGASHVSIGALVVGFIAAFVAGVLACKLMIGIVNRGKLKYFAFYCFLAGIIAITSHLL